MGHRRLQERLLWFLVTIIIFSPLLTILFFTSSDVFSDGQNDASFAATILEKKATSIQPTSESIANTFKVARAVNINNTLEILGRRINLVDTNTTESTPGNAVAQYFGATSEMQGKFFFGHNSANLLSGLANLGFGSTFKITKNNTTKTYQVKKVIVVPNDATLLRNMPSIAKAQYQGVSYGVSIMTCAGTSYGNGNATHRVLVFADTI